MLLMRVMSENGQSVHDLHSLRGCPIRKRSFGFGAG